jgi:hypothetical protein
MNMQSIIKYSVIFNAFQNGSTPDTSHFDNCTFDCDRTLPEAGKIKNYYNVKLDNGDNGFLVRDNRFRIDASVNSNGLNSFPVEHIMLENYSLSAQNNGRVLFNEMYNYSSWNSSLSSGIKDTGILFVSNRNANYNCVFDQNSFLYPGSPSSRSVYQDIYINDGGFASNTAGKPALNKFQDINTSYPGTFYHIYSANPFSYFGTNSPLSSDGNLGLYNSSITRNAASLIINEPYNTFYAGFYTFCPNPNNLPNIPIKLNYRENETIIYPNPASNRLFIEIGNNNNENSSLFYLYDIHGRLIESYKIIGNKNEINIKNLSDGIYQYLLISEEGYIKNGKIIVLH